MWVHVNKKKPSGGFFLLTYTLPHTRIHTYPHTHSHTHSYTFIFITGQPTIFFGPVIFFMFLISASASFCSLIISARKCCPMIYFLVWYISQGKQLPNNHSKLLPHSYFCFKFFNPIMLSGTRLFNLAFLWNNRQKLTQFLATSPYFNPTSYTR